MCRRLIYSVSFVLVLGLALMSVAKAADPDLAAHWKFDEGSGTIAHDATGNGNDGVFVGDPQWVPGKLGGALEFNGDDYLNCGNGPSLQIQDEITITFWFQVEAFQNSWEAFLAKSDNAYRASRSATTGNATHMGASGSSVGGGNGWFDAAIIVTDGQWHHWAGVYDGTEGRIYIDGELDTASPGTGQINLTSSDLYIGENSGATGRFLHGLLDDVRIYSRALTDTEILGVMAGGGAEYPLASSPNPADDAFHSDTWVSLGWRAGDWETSPSRTMYIWVTILTMSTTAPAMRSEATSPIHFLLPVFRDFLIRMVLSLARPTTGASMRSMMPMWPVRGKVMSGALQFPPGRPIIPTLLMAPNLLTRMQTLAGPQVSVRNCTPCTSAIILTM